jgi:uncharacterized SAM-binding protein YcdF (DUF218 family)
MFELYLTRILQSLIFPPGGILLVILVGLLLHRYRPVWGKGLLWLGLVVGYLLSTPLVSFLLQQPLQSYPALSEMEIRQAPAQAIIILSGDRYPEAPEYGGDTVGEHTLVRVRYGAYLQRLTGLPIVVTGGHVIDQEGESLAAMMANTLRDDFGAHDVWLEERSRTTAENAFFTRSLIEGKHIDTVLLVTHATHMPRSVAIFEQAGLKVIPAPTRFEALRGSWLFYVLPNARALQRSYSALHELVGRFWYLVRY